MKKQLAQGRVNRRDFLVIDAGIDRVAQRRQYWCFRGMPVGVDAGQLVAAVPDLAVDVVRKSGRTPPHGQAEGQGEK